MTTSAVTPKVIVLCGPTGISKTATAIQLADRYGGEIVSADSMQVYRYMDIGTAKPSQKEQRQVRHHLIDIVNPDEAFSAGRYARMAGDTLAGLHDRGVLPFIVGGTGLYIKACLHGLFRRQAADEKVLERLTREARQLGASEMHKRLAFCDPEAAQTINKQDTFRIVRALEIYETTGKPLSAFRREHNFSRDYYAPLKLCLFAAREMVYNRIDRRVEAMMEQGLAEEVADLLARGYTPDLKSMQSLGYRHMVRYLRQEISWPEMISTMKRDTRRYAKRQLTWFRADPEINWIPLETAEESLDRLIEQFIQQDRV